MTVFSGTGNDIIAIGDRIDSSGIAGFSFVSGGFTAANQVRVTLQGGGNYLVEAETSGGGNIDMSVLVTSDHALSPSDFVGVSAASPAGAGIAVAAVHVTAEAGTRFGNELTVGNLFYKRVCIRSGLR